MSLKSTPSSSIHLQSISIFLHLYSEIQDHIYCGCSIKAEAKVRSNSTHRQSLPTTLVITNNTGHCQQHWSLPTTLVIANSTGHCQQHWSSPINTNEYRSSPTSLIQLQSTFSMTLTIYSNSHLIDTMTHSTLTSFCASRQPSRQPSEPPISARLSPVPEPLPSQVPESIIDHDEAINLMLPVHQQGSSPECNNSSDSSSNASQHGQPYSANPAHPANLAYPFNPLSNLASLLGTPPTIPANLLANPGNPLANIPANQANNLS